MHPLASWIILSYATVLIVGGLFGWRLGGSRLSFTFGLASTAPLTVAHQLSQIHPSGGYRMATGVSLALAVVFFLRFRKTGKFLPAGLLLALSGMVGVILGWITAMSRSAPLSQSTSAAKQIGLQKNRSASDILSIVA